MDPDAFYSILTVICNQTEWWSVRRDMATTNTTFILRSRHRRASCFFKKNATHTIMQPRGLIQWHGDNPRNNIDGDKRSESLAWWHDPSCMNAYKAYAQGSKVTCTSKMPVRCYGQILLIFSNLWKLFVLLYFFHTQYQSFSIFRLSGFMGVI
jgi:hypothetical protein